MTEQPTEQEKKRKYSDEELIAFAKRPDLLRYIRRDLDKFIVGEDANKMSLFMICMSKIQPRPLGAVVTGGSSAGKNHLAGNVIQYFDRVHSFSRITPTSLERYEQNMNNSILFLKELGGLQAHPALRIMMSEGGLRLLSTSPSGETEEFVTEGTPTFITTTTNYQIERQLQNRILILSMDETEKQTGAILDYQAKDLELQDSQIVEPDPLIIEFLKSGILQPHNIAVPYAKGLATAFPRTSITARRDFKKLGTLIRMSTFVHQYQRRKIQDPNMKMRYYILADKNDFFYAFNIAGKTLEQTLAGVQRRSIHALEIFKLRNIMTSRQLGDALKISRYRARHIANALVNVGYLHKDDSEKTHVFELREAVDIDLEKLKNPLEDWNEDKLESWLQSLSLVIKEDAPLSYYVEALSAKLGFGDHRSKIEDDSLSQTQSKNKSVPQRLLSTSLTNDRQNLNSQRDKEEKKND